jgi:uncharacterized cupin superfamily protein
MTDWFVRNARDLTWSENEMGAYCDLLQAGDGAAEEFAINLNVLGKGQPMAMYHREPHQEGFLVLRGECVLVAEGEELPLRAWDYVHCDPDVNHVIVGAGDEPALVLAVGSRVGPDAVVYPVDARAAALGAAAERETTDPRESYARFSRGRDVAYREEFLA